MTTDTIEILTVKLKQAEDNNNGLIAQLEAAKQMFNESLNGHMQTKTLFVMAQKQVKALSMKLIELQMQMPAVTAPSVVNQQPTIEASVSGQDAA